MPTGCTAGITSGCCSSARRAKTCWTVITRWGRLRPRNAIVQLKSAARRFLNPVKKARCTTSHMSHAHEAGSLDPADQGDGAEAGDRRHRAAIVVAERSTGRVSPKPADDGFGGVTPRLNRDLSYPGQPVEAHQIANDEDLGVPRKGEVRLDLHPARAIHFGTGPVGEQAAQGRGLHAGGPDLGGRFDPAQLRVGRVGLQTALVNVRDRGVHVDLDPERAQVARGARPERVGERGEDRRRGIEQQHPRSCGVDAAEVLAQRTARQLGELAGELHARGARPHHDEGEPAAPRGGIALVLCHLESAEDPAPQLQGVVDGLHSRRIDGEFGVTEIRLAHAGGDDQAVIGNFSATLERVYSQKARADIDIHHLAREDPGVRLAAEDLADGGRDLTLGQNAGRQLVQERLEQVMVGPVDEGDIDIRSPQGLGGEQPAKAAAHDRDAMPPAGLRGARRATLLSRDIVMPPPAPAFAKRRG